MRVYIGQIITERLFTRLGLSAQIYLFHLYCLAHVAEWNPSSLHDLAHYLLSWTCTTGIRILHKISSCQVGIWMI